MVKIRTIVEIGIRLRLLREKAGYSQEKLAELIEVSRFQIQKYERGQDMLITEKLQLLADALSVPIQTFFISNDSETLPLAVEEKLLKVIPQQYRLHAHHWLILHGRYV